MSVSVITVTFNNAEGLRRTLESLSLLPGKPFEVLVMDGGSRDHTAEVVELYSRLLNIRFYTEPDAGIYDAMNKGHERAQGSLIHYLNAGDIVWGDPYNCSSDSGEFLLPVRILSIDGKFLWNDKPKLFGYAYCHQGVVFRKGHPRYNLAYTLAADLDVLMRTFPAGLDMLALSRSGGASFFLGGQSSSRTVESDSQVRQVFRNHAPPLPAALVCIQIRVKQLLPKAVRHQIAKLLFYRKQTSANERVEKSEETCS